MKRILTWLLLIIFIFLAALLTLPIIFKGSIVSLVKEQANKNLNARVDFGDFGMSLLNSFPNFSFSIEDVVVVGINEFEGDTLLSVGELDLTVDLMSLIRRENIVIEAIDVHRLNVRARVLGDGRANWNIMKEKESGGEEAEGDEGTGGGGVPFNILLKRLTIHKADIVYENARDGIDTEMKGLEFSLSGDLSKDSTTLATRVTITSLTAEMDKKRYLNNARLSFKADIEADLADGRYTLKENELRLNEVALQWNGSVSLPGNGIKLNMRFKAPETKFKDVLSLIPAIYTRDFQDIQTTGELALDGYIRGIYSAGRLPSFGIGLSVNNATFHYPDLPESAEDINIKSSITNRGGNIDDTVINIEKFHFEVAKNPVDIRLVLKKPISDKEIHCRVKGELDLNKLSDVVPLGEGEDISGLITSDITMSGKVSDVQAGRYEDFKATGEMSLRGVRLASTSLPQVLAIREAHLNFSPRQVELAGLNGKIGRSDFQANGALENFVPYLATDDATLEGTFESRSHLLDLNELTGGRDKKSIEASNDTVRISIINIPGNIDFTLKSSFDKILYEKVTMTKVKGLLKIKDKKLIMEDLGMDLLGGTATVNGSYDARIPEKPMVDLDLDVSKWNIPLAFKALNTIRVIAPIAENCSGSFSSRLHISSALDEHMNPVFNTLTGSGGLRTDDTTIRDSKTLDVLASTLKNDRFKTLEFRNLDMSLQFRDGRVFVKPFKAMIGNTRAVISGSNGFDQTMDYSMKMDIPTQEFGGHLNDFLGGLSSSLTKKTGVDISMADMAKTVRVELRIGGTFHRPTVRIGSLNLIGSGGKALTSQLSQELRKEAEKAIREAEKQAASIRDNARKAADNLRREGYAQAAKLESEAKNPIARMAAKAAADRIRKETDKKADKIISEGDQRAAQIVDEARKKAGSSAP